MPDKIRLLPDTVASQIAAGEVVNRPASVVKEMMENSVDAGATAITVSYRNGGKELIKVIDDGEGMSPLDARMAFDKHATSKITRIEDVYALHTFGFRGEALASIAAIAHVELTTRRPEDSLARNIGWRIDHVLGTRSAAALCRSVSVERELRAAAKPSDHTAVVAEFDYDL